MRINKKLIIKTILYFAGQIILALGLVLNTKADLGISAITSTAYVTSVILDRKIGDTQLVIYIIFIVAQIIIHLKNKKFADGALDVGQLGVSFLITRIMNVFTAIIPTYHIDYPESFLATIWGRALILFAALVFTAIGAATTMKLHFLPNPGDGIVMVIADELKKDTGLIKNCLDATCVIISVIIGLATRGRIIGIGFGTIAAVVCVGRFIALYNKIFGRFFEKLMAK